MLSIFRNIKHDDLFHLSFSLLYLFQNEIMTGVVDSNPVVSRFTLALLEDSGLVILSIFFTPCFKHVQGLIEYTLRTKVLCLLSIAVCGTNAAEYWRKKAASEKYCLVFATQSSIWSSHMLSGIFCVVQCPLHELKFSILLDDRYLYESRQALQLTTLVLVYMFFCISQFSLVLL